MKFIPLLARLLLADGQDLFLARGVMRGAFDGFEKPDEKCAPTCGEELLFLKGWAVNASLPGGGVPPVNVSITLDGQVVATAVANIKRTDLVKAKVAPNPEHGFHIQLPAAAVKALQKGKHALGAIIVGDGDTWSVPSSCDSVACAPPGPPELNGHPLKLDADGMIETWLPNATAHHDFIVRAMDHLARLPPAVPESGLPPWITHGQLPVYNNANNPACVFSIWAQVASSLQAYTGDATWLSKVSFMLEYLLVNGTTPADPSWTYPSVPYASSDPGAWRYRGAADWDDFHTGDISTYNPIGRGDGYGVLQPDKIGMVGSAYILMWKHDKTKTHFLEAALRCAETLAATMNHDANTTHSPWPFRVYAETGIVRQAYTSHVLANIELFDQLLALNNSSPVTPTVAAQLRRARDGAWSWLVSFPLKNGNWCGYFEDITIAHSLWKTYGNITTCNYDNIQPLLLAQYMLQHRTPDWQRHVPSLIEFVERRLIFAEKPFRPAPKNQPAVYHGARCVSEQQADMARMSDHTIRYATTLAKYADAIRATDPAAAAAAAENSRRSWAWASYCLEDDGMVIVGPHIGPDSKRTWFSDTICAVSQTLTMIGVRPKGWIW